MTIGLEAVKPTNKAPRLMPGRLIGMFNHITGGENIMLKTILYIIFTAVFGAWLIYQLSTNSEIDRTKSKMENRTQTINRIINELED